MKSYEHRKEVERKIKDKQMREKIALLEEAFAHKDGALSCATSNPKASKLYSDRADELREAARAIN